MTLDYAEIAADALELVTEAGRSVTLVELNNTPADAQKPWRGATDPRLVPTATLAVPAVFVEPSSAQWLGLHLEISDFVKKSSQIAIVASTADLKSYNEIIDTDSTRWRITGMEQLKPASTSLLYFIGLTR